MTTAAIFSLGNKLDGPMSHKQWNSRTKLIFLQRQRPVFTHNNLVRLVVPESTPTRLRADPLAGTASAITSTCLVETSLIS